MEAISLHFFRVVNLSDIKVVEFVSLYCLTYELACRVLRYSAFVSTTSVHGKMFDENGNTCDRSRSVSLSCNVSWFPIFTE